MVRIASYGTRVAELLVTVPAAIRVVVRISPVVVGGEFSG
jgi:hypothetical protein